MTQYNETDSYNDNIGYSEIKGYYFILIFSILSIVMNIIFILKYLLEKLINKKRKKISSLEQILFILSISDSSIALLWLISAIKFKQRKSLLENNSPNICKKTMIY